MCPSMGRLLGGLLGTQTPLTSRPNIETLRTAKLEVVFRFDKVESYDLGSLQLWFPSEDKVCGVFGRKGRDWVPMIILIKPSPSLLLLRASATKCSGSVDRDRVARCHHDQDWTRAGERTSY